MDRIGQYLAYAQANPGLFATPEGGVRILLVRGEIEAVERDVRASLVARGFDPSGAEVGVVLRDPWFSMIRDAVEFPDGARRLHARVVNHIGNGVAVLPVYEGRLVLIRHFRHPPRRFLLEIPRGGMEPGQSPEDTARQELAEEIGARVTSLVELGFVLGSANLYANGAHLFLAQVDHIGEPQLAEGIVAIERIEVAEFERRLGSGEIVDSFTVAAFCHARLRGLI